jgi:homoserine kinase
VGSARVLVTVPATSANLGPGFDSLGLALSLRDELEGELTGSGASVEVTGECAESVPRDESHLVVRAMRTAFEAMAVPQPGIRLLCRNTIPHSRGLGSSSAAIVGGLVLARALAERDWSDEDLLEVAARLEGHPDNVAPALLGGFTISGTDEHGDVYAVGSPVDPRIRAEAFVPPEGVSTELARGLLPATVPHADAAGNTGAAALLVAALAGRPDQLWRATRDYLHQQYRRTAMPASVALVEELRGQGIAAVVSGAGPTVLALVAGGPDLADVCPAGWTHHRLAVDTSGATAAPV